jgi:hypothetical protein
MAFTRYRQVDGLHAYAKDRFHNGLAYPPTTDVNLSIDPPPYNIDNAEEVPTYSVPSSGDLYNIDVHTDKKRIAMHRNGKDTALTVPNDVQLVNPYDPRLSYMVPPEDYSRLTNKLQHYQRGVSGRVEALNGKRKAVSDLVNGAVVEMNFGDSTPLQNVSANIAVATRGIDNLTTFPNVVEYQVSLKNTNKDAIMGTKPTNTADLVKQANTSFEQSEERFSPDSIKVRS